MKYDFKTVEAKWQKVWEDEDTFHAGIIRPASGSFFAVTVAAHSSMPVTSIAACSTRSGK